MLHPLCICDCVIFALSPLLLLQHFVACQLRPAGRQLPGVLVAALTAGLMVLCNDGSDIVIDFHCALQTCGEAPHTQFSAIQARAQCLLGHTQYTILSTMSIMMALLIILAAPPPPPH